MPVIATSFFAESIRPKTRAESPTSQAARGCVLTSKAIPWRQRARVLCRARVPGAAIKRGYFEVSAYERARSHRDEGTGRTIPAPASGPANSRAGQHRFHSSRFSFRFPQCVSLRSGFERPFDLAVQTTQHPDARVIHEPNKKAGRSRLPGALMTSRN